MIASSATPLGAFAYIAIFLMLIAFTLGMFAGHLVQVPQRLKVKDYQDVFTAGYHQGLAKGQQDNTGNTEAFQQGYTNGYTQAVIDLAQPRTPKSAAAAMQEQPLPDPDEPPPDEPVRYDNHRPQQSEQESTVQFVDWLRSSHIS